MNDKQQSRPASRNEVPANTSGDDKDQDELLGNLPDNMKPLDTITDDMTIQMLDLAKKLVEIARQKLGKESSKPRRQEVVDLFKNNVPTPPKVDGDLDTSIRRLGTVEQVAALDQDYDKAMAGAFNALDKVSADAGSKVQQAIDDWTMGVRLYQAAERSAGAILKAGIESAKVTSGAVSSDPSFRDRAQLEHYTNTSAVATALVAYEKSMAKATADLSTAFGKLINGLYAGYTQVAVGEATSLASQQAASLAFWTKLHADLSKSRK